MLSRWRSNEQPKTPAAIQEPIPVAPGSASPAAVDATAHGTLVQLRDIMLGSLLHDQEQAIARLEDRVVAQAARLGSELATLVQRLEDRIDALDARASRDRGGLDHQLATQKQLLRSEIEERSSQVSQLGKDEIAKLGAAKLDRAQFSNFLSGLATHIESVGSEALAADQASPTAKSADESNGYAATRAPWHPLQKTA